MRYQETFFTASESMVEDEIDQLFLTQLAPVEPPPALISRILSFAAQPSQPSIPWEGRKSPLHWDTLDLSDNGKPNVC